MFDIEFPENSPRENPRKMQQLELKAGTRPPWVGLAAAVWVSFAAGNNYNFALFSPALKSVLGFNQQQITFLGVANDIGGSVGILAGIACNKLPPWKVLLFGALACFSGYGLLWLAVSQTLQNLPYCLLWIALLIGSNSSAWFQTAVIVTNMRNFPMSRGTVSGILKGYVGLSAAMYTVIYSLVLDKSDPAFLLFLSLGLPIICFCAMYLIRPCTPASGKDPFEHVHFLFTQGSCLILAIYLLTITIIIDKFSLGATISYTFFAIMVIFLLVPLAIPIKMTILPANKRSPGSVASSEEIASGESKSDLTEPLLEVSRNVMEDKDATRVDILLAEGLGAVRRRKGPHRGEDFRFHEVLVKADFWLLWLVYFVGVGSGVTVLNNLAQIGYAQGELDTTFLLSLFSFFNFVGRLGGGAVSEHFVRSKSIPRTVWMTVSQAIMIVTFLLYTSSLRVALYAATPLLGICYGVHSAVMTPTASELFGLKHVGVIYNFIQLGNPMGAFLFSGLLAGNLYDAEAAKQGGSTCLGASCFGLTFLLLAGVCGLGLVLSLILTIRIRPVYRALYSSGSFQLPQKF